MPSTTVLLTTAPRPRAPLPAARVSVSPGEVAQLFVNDVVGARFLARMQRDDLRHLASRTFPWAEPGFGDLDALGAVDLTWTTGDALDALVVLHDRDLPALLVRGHSACEAVVAAAEPSVAAAAVRDLERALRDDPPPDERVPLCFWAYEDGRGDVRQRSVEAPAWTDVAPNYPAVARAAVDALAGATEPVGGSLLLWHGPPGTGKTHALQALARAWRPWCSTHYVTDPEQLLAGTAYLMDVATRTLDEDAPPWRLIVLEDAGELMAADARSEVGQGLSRMLNLTDGLLGQGLRCILLVTTNEPIGRLHPAIRRPGRCWAQVEFPAFDVPEATAWLARREVDHTPTTPLTLAELYAVAEGRTPDGDGPGAERYGFARALSPAR